MKTWLLDTGPLVAYLDGHDPFHSLVKPAIIGFRGEFWTTSAVVVETTHFLAAMGDGVTRLVEFLEKTRAHIVECTTLPQLKAAAALMKKYADTPMDFADATLVLLSDMVGTEDICTLDRRGFSVFRTPRGRRFRLVLG